MKTLGAKLQVTLLFLTVCGSTILYGQITPSQDAYTNTASPTKNFGGSTLLNVQSASQTTYIQFDLSSVPATYTGANVSKAMLKLYVNSVTTAGSFNLDYVSGSWSESTITANLAPALGTTIVGGVNLTATNALDYILIDITPAVQAWLDGTPNDGIALVANSPLNASFDSKENTTNSHAAELDIVFATDVTVGSGLIAGGTTGNVSLNLTNTCAANQVLEWNGSAWACASTGTGTITGVTAGPGLTGGGNSGNVPLKVDATQVPFLNSANTFTGNQTVNGNLSATGVVSAASYQIGSNLFAFGSYGGQNAFLGFAGNTTTNGYQNTATGWQALLSNTSGPQNTADGFFALSQNTSGVANTAVGANALSVNTMGAGNSASGVSALAWNTSGVGNTAGGYGALASNTTASNNTGLGYLAGNPPDNSSMTAGNSTFLGAFAVPSTGTLTNVTAIGAYSEVSESNAMVLGSINGVNGSNADTLVGVGTTAPSFKLHVGTINHGLRVEGPPTGGSGAVAISVGGNGDVGIDAPGIVDGRFVVKDGSGFVGVGTANPDSRLSVNGSADKPGGGSWGTFSDRRLKTLDGSFTSGLSQVLKINPVRYRYKEENAMGIRDRDEHVGLVAQEVQSVIPEAVTENSKGYLLVNNDPIVWAMLNAIKEQQQEIASLRAELRKRAAKDTRLESRLAELEHGQEKRVRVAPARLAQ